MTNIMPVGWRLSSANFTTLILMDLDLMARRLSLSPASHLRHKHRSQPEWETRHRTTREGEDSLSHQYMGTMLSSALKHNHCLINTTALPVRWISKEIRHKDLIWDKKKEHQTHQVGKSAPRPPFLQSHPEQPLRTCRHPHHPYSLVSAFQLRARSWMTLLSYCSTETRLMYQVTGISASIYKCQIGNNKPGCSLHHKSICWQKNLFCYL